MEGQIWPLDLEFDTCSLTHQYNCLKPSEKPKLPQGIGSRYHHQDQGASQYTKKQIFIFSVAPTVFVLAVDVLGTVAHPLSTARGAQVRYRTQVRC